VIHYDQVGNGRSTHLPDKPPEFWTVQLFLDELASLVDTLESRTATWCSASLGGMLGAEHATLRPPGLRGLVIADSPAAMSLWAGARRAPGRPAARGGRHAACPREAGTTDSEAYHEAMRVFYDRHVCRVVPWPDEVARTFAAIDEDPTVVSRR